MAEPQIALAAGIAGIGCGELFTNGQQLEVGGKRLLPLPCRGERVGDPARSEIESLLPLWIDRIRRQDLSAIAMPLRYESIASARLPAALKALPILI